MLDIKTTNLILYCDKWQQCVDFYKSKLGLEISVEKKWFIEFRLNQASCLSIANAANTFTKSSNGNGLTITLEVNDINKSYDDILAAGINPTAIKDHSWGAKVFYIFDPEGNRTEIWSTT